MHGIWVQWGYSWLFNILFRSIQHNTESALRVGELLPLKMRSMKWGLVLSKTPESSGIHPINARDDSVMNPSPKPLFSRLRDKHRCIVIAQGFYEWEKKKGGHKVPYFIRHKNEELLYMAGLYHVIGKDTPSPIYSYTILTTDTTSKLSFLHDRIPIFLNTNESLTTWMSDEPWSSNLETSVIHADDSFLTWYPVDPRVGKVGLNDPTFMQPIKESEHGLTSLWTPKTNVTSELKQALDMKNESKLNASSTSLSLSPSTSTSSLANLKDPSSTHTKKKYRKRKRKDSVTHDGSVKVDQEKEVVLELEIQTQTKSKSKPKPKTKTKKEKEKEKEKENQSMKLPSFQDDVKEVTENNENTSSKPRNQQIGKPKKRQKY
ncbi:hypothetical protein HMI54_009136 [Coelomomyces lativittatus]|nr:hypothetical protein HMI54_009136 [Coelomomyces lativittatus]KAJ1504736.1 hypothetical protein HMI55_001898 [Coelomomyces lativittatus]